MNIVNVEMNLEKQFRTRFINDNGVKHTFVYIYRKFILVHVHEIRLTVETDFTFIGLSFTYSLYPESLNENWLSNSL